MMEKIQICGQSFRVYILLQSNPFSLRATRLRAVFEKKEHKIYSKLFYVRVIRTNGIVELKHNNGEQLIV